MSPLHFRILNWREASWLAAPAVAIVLGIPGLAQVADKGAAAAIAEQCSGPLGAYIPECQAVKSAPVIAPASKTGNGGGPEAPSLRAPSSRESSPSDKPDNPPPPPPEPPSEFQRFAASSVGQVLPIFGTDLFARVPSTFAPLERIPVPADHVLGPGDEILLRVWGQVNLDLALTVDRSGAVFVPRAGNINVSGVSFQKLPEHLRAELGRVFRNFDLTVTMGQLRSIQIFVVGKTRRPGTYTVSSLSTLVNALFTSGGPSAQGSMRRIQLKRDAAVVTEFDLYDLLIRGDKSKDVPLQPGDVVYVPPVGPQVALAGSVKTPGIYELRGEQTAGEVIQMAGGCSPLADAQRATLERIQNRASREVIAITLDSAGLATRIADGDVLNLLTISPQYSNAVTLRGNVANPGRFPWRPGMHLRDVIPDKASLVTRDYWQKRNVLGYIPPTDRLPGEPDDIARHHPAETRITKDTPEINWSYAVVERQNPRDLRSDLLPFHLGKLVLENDPAQNLELRPGDVVTIFSQSDVRVPLVQQTRLVRMEGEFNAAGIYNAQPGETLGQLIARAGGLTKQAYLFGAELTRESTRQDQQHRLDQFVREMERELDSATSLRSAASSPEELAALQSRLAGERQFLDRLRSVKATGRIVLNLEPGSNDIRKLMDIPVEDGDRFTIPSRPATINVLGAVYNQNSFLHEENLRISDYLREAGGTARNADRNRIFVIRADGAVVPKQGVRKFDSRALHPGDTIVVPEQAFKSPLLRGLRDWTQVLSQLALGAAAVNILR